MAALRAQLSDLIAETSTVLEDCGVKFVACYTLAVGLAIVAAAGSLRARTIEELAAPTANAPTNDTDRGMSDASQDSSDNKDNGAQFQIPQLTSTLAISISFSITIPTSPARRPIPIAPATGGATAAGMATSISSFGIARNPSAACSVSMPV